ncbi:unnamed protein product [Orchesella dallaii]|uniref:BPTI/Kunitz inhibitor domain-containing protein n=1 Tax=Orchesella dallaii TaxID=48710 RepID=A0ABP1PWG8_9HEXA
METLKTNRLLVILLVSFLMVAITFTGAEGRRRTPPPGACFQKMMPGNCRGFYPRWYYNRKTSRCEGFTYGGCQGNLNNFKSMEECEMKCHKMTLWGA